MTKEKADGERSNQARVEGNHVVYRGQRFKLGKAQRGTVVPDDGPTKIKAMRLRLEELEEA